MNLLQRRQTGQMVMLGLACLLLGGCGFKSRPLPPQKQLPVAPLELQARQLGVNMLISWTMPDKNQDDTPVTDLAGFNLYRLLYDPLDNCPECIDRSTLLQRIDLDYPVNARIIDKRVFVVDRDVKPGKGYQYRVAARTGKAREGASAKVRLQALTPPSAPTGLKATGHDRMVRLSWESVTPTGADETLLGYQLYRGGANEKPIPAAINTAVLSDTRYDDFEVENNLAYSYQVRALVKRGKTTLESPASQLISVTPQVGQ